MPMNNALDVAITQTLSWTGDAAATDYDVYFSNTLLGLADADRASPAFLTTTPDTSATPPTSVMEGQQYFWRVDTNGPSEVIRGATWTYTYGLPDRAPDFDGIRAALAVGPTAIRLDWAAAADDLDEASSLAYEVYVATTSGAQAFAEPTVIVTGATSVVLTSAELSGLAAGDTYFFVVRVVDSVGNRDLNNNEVSVIVPDSANRAFVDAGASAGGDGSLAAPYQTIQAGVDAIAASGGLVAVAAGRYGEQIRLVDTTGNTGIEVRGGFPMFVAGTSDADLINAWDPDTHHTIVDGAGLSYAVNEGLVHVANDFRPTKLSGLILEEAVGYTPADEAFWEFAWDRTPPTLTGSIGALVTAIDADLTLQRCHLRELDATTVASFGVRFANPSNGGRLAVLASEIEGMPIGLGLTGGVRSIHWVGNFVHETTFAIMDTISPILTEWTSEPDESLVVTPEGVPLELVIENNRHANNVRGIYVRAETANAAVPSALSVSVRNNFVTGHGLGTDDANQDRLSETVDARDANGFNLRASDVFPFLFEQIGLFGEGGSTTVNIEDNVITGSIRDSFSVTFTDREDLLDGGFDVRDVGASVDFVVRGNAVGHTDSDIFDLDNVSVARNGATRLLFEHNTFLPAESEGIRLNMRQDGVETDVGVNGVFELVVRENFFGSTDGPTELRVYPPVNGFALIDISENEVPGNHEDFGLDIRRGVRIDDDGPVSTLLSAKPGTDAGADVDIFFRNNVSNNEDEMAEFDIAPTGGDIRLVVTGNTCFSGDDECWEQELLNAYYYDDPGQLLMVFFNNNFNNSDDEALVIEGVSDIIDDWEVDLYIGQNEMVGVHEQDSIDVQLPGNSLFAIHRNLAGLNDVDSEPATRIRTGSSQGASATGWIMNNIFAFGAQSALRLERVYPTVINNTLAFSGRYGSDRAGLDVDGGGDNPTLVLNNIVYGNHASDLDVDEPVYATYSLTEFASEGLGNVSGNPNFLAQSIAGDFRNYFRLGASSPAIDAGDPDAVFNDLDGSRNDIGAFGGPAAGVIGLLGPEASMPLVVIGIRPLGDLASGRRLWTGSETLTVVFNQEVDESTIDANTLAITADGSPIAGSYSVEGNRVRFTPNASLSPGALVDVVADTAIQTTDARALDFIYRQTFAVQAASTAEVEDSELIANAQVLAGGNWSVDGATDPGAVAADAVDHYSVAAVAGERIRATVFYQRDFDSNQTGDYNLELVGPDMTTVLVAADDHFGGTEINEADDSSSSTTRSDPYLNFVIPTDGTYILRVTNVGTGGSTYELQGYLE